MKCVEFDTPEAMWRECEAYLSRDAANNTQTLSALQRVRRHGARHAERFFAALDTSDAVVGTVLRVDTKTAFLSCMPPAVSRLLGRAMHERAVAFAGVAGVAETVIAFTAGYGQPTRPFASLMLYRHEGVVRAGDADGRARVATTADVEAVTGMLEAFDIELAMIKTTVPTVERAARRIAGEEIIVWEVNGDAVAMAGMNPLPAGSARVGPVYVLPEQRRRGIAQAVTAAATQHAQHGGPRTVFLFADATNPASNKAYQRIGYRHVADHLHVLY